MAVVSISLPPEPRQGDSTAPLFSAFPFDGYVPKGGEGIHDPAVLTFGGRYFCFCTSGNGFGLVRTSDDLIHWKLVGPVLPDSPAWLQAAIPGHRSIWAPEAVKFGEGLRLYYCASARFGHNDSFIGVAQCDRFDVNHPTQGWHDLGLIVDSKEGRDNFNAIDPSVLTCPDGRQWMFFGSYWSGLYVSELDPATGKLKNSGLEGRKLVACNPADRANGLEAPCCVYRDGFYYLFVNYGLAAQGIRSTYQIVVGRSKTPDGPFLDANGKSMVDGGHESVLNSSSPMFGPGGGVEFKDTDGRWLMSYHYYDGRAFWHDHTWGLPTLQIRELLWTADGWPVPGLPVTPETNLLARNRLPSPVGTWTQQVDFGRISALTIKADGSCALGDVEGRWRQNGDQLEIRWPRDDAPGEFWIDNVLLANGGHYFAGRNQAGNVIRGLREGRG